MSNSSVIYSGSESIWCCIRYMLKMSFFMLKIRLKYFFRCEFSAILTKLTDFFLFSDNVGVYLFVFQAEKMFLNVWFIIGVCVFKRI